MLTVPSSALNYKNAEVWKKFEPIKSGILFVVEVNNPECGSVTVNKSAEQLHPFGTTINFTANPASQCFLWKWTSGETVLGNANSLSISLDQDTVIVANFGKIDTVDLVEAGTLKDQPNIKNVTHLIVTGIIDAQDIRFMRDNMQYLTDLDLTEATVENYSGDEGTVQGQNDYPANEMPEYSFYDQISKTGKTSLVSVKLPKSITSVGSKSFTDCTGLTSVTIGKLVETIGDFAFFNCSRLISINNLSLTPQDIEDNVFDGVNKNTCILTVQAFALDDYKDANAWKEFRSINSGVTFAVKVNNPEWGNVTADFRDGLYPANTTINLTAISASQCFFWKWTSGKNYLSNASALKVVLKQDTVIVANFGKADTVDFTVAGTLKDRPNIKNITHLTVTGNIDARDVRFMRDDMPNLTSLDLTGATVVKYEGKEGPYPSNSIYPYPADEMPEYSFYNSITGNTALVSVKLPENITSVGEFAFSDCRGLDSIIIPNSVTTIKDGAFSYCSGLTGIIIPNSVTTVGGVAFSDCPNLTSVTIGTSVTSIGNYAFARCSNLVSINNLSVTPQIINPNVFNNVNKNYCTLTVPTSALDDYQGTDVWKEFTSTNSGVLFIVKVNNPAWGSVTVNQPNGLYPSGSRFTLNAIPAPNYTLWKWRGGETILGNEELFTVELTQDTVITAEFGITVNHTNGIIYVKQDGAGNADGSSWSNAYPNLADPLQYAVQYNMEASEGEKIKQIWVAEGIYYPMHRAGDGTHDRDKSFVLVPDIKIYGGFSSSSVDSGILSDRNCAEYPTVLSGDIDGDNTLDGNVYHVVTGAGNTANNFLKTVVLDGFTITGGYADDSNTITVNGQSSRRDYGGGIYNVNASPVLSRLTVSGNFAMNGGGIANYESSNPVFANVVVSGNSAENGGGIVNQESSPLLVNVTVAGNRADSNGGGITNNNSSPEFFNSIVWGNTAIDENINVHNINSRTLFSYSLIQGSRDESWNNDIGIDKGNNIDADPLFDTWIDPSQNDWVATVSGDYRISVGSPAINSGDSVLYKRILDITGFAGETDLQGELRKSGSNIDIGAYEYTKMEQPEVSELAVDSLTPFSIMLKEITNAEYRIGTTGKWQDSPVFDGLQPNTSYTFYARYKETDTHKAGPTSEFTTATDIERFGISLDPEDEYTFEEAAYGYDEQQLEYSVKVRNTGNCSVPELLIALNGPDRDAFSLSLQTLSDLAVDGYHDFTIAPKANLGARPDPYRATVMLRISRTDIIESFDVSFTVKKADRSAPHVKLASRTATSVTLVTLENIEDAEYRIDTGDWQSNPIFDNLLPQTPYTFYARMKETAMYNTGKTSEAFTVTTYGTEAKLVSISIDDVEILIGDNQSEYIADCDKTEVTLNLEGSSDSITLMSVDSAVIQGTVIPLLNDEYETPVIIKIVSEDGSSQINYHTLRIYRALEGLLYNRHWSNVNVLAINTNPDHNGGHRNIENFRWYNNNKDTIGHDQFIRIENGTSASDYYPEISIDGRWHKVCGVPEQKNVGSIVVYPNPVVAGDNLTLQLPVEFVGGSMDVISISGSVMKRNVPLPDKQTAVSFPDLPSGIYMLNITGINGNREIVKIIIGN
jgi:hypothetical protein